MPNRQGKLGHKGFTQKGRPRRNVLATMFNRACLTAVCDLVTVRESKPPSAGPGQNYRRFALATLAIGVLVAFAASDNDAAVAQPSAAPAPAALQVKAAPKLVRPASSWAMSDDAEPAQAAAEGEAAASPDPVRTDAPPMPGSSAAPAAPVAGPSKADRPSPAQIDRLVAASRERSGGVEQGDEQARPVV